MPPKDTFLQESRFVVPLLQGLQSFFPQLSFSPGWVLKRRAERGIPDFSATYPLTKPLLLSLTSSITFLHFSASLPPGDAGQKIEKSLVFPPSFLNQPLFFDSFILALSSLCHSLGR